MTFIVTGNEFNTNRSKELAEARLSFDYKYPEGIDLTPGKDIHNNLLAHLQTQLHDSYSAMSKRYESWRRIDRTLTAFIPTDDKEKKVTDKDARRPTSIVFPYSYAMLETLLTFMASTFFQDPIFKYEGQGPEDTLGAMMLQLNIQYQMYKSQAILALHTWYRDGLSYGIGIIAPKWGEVNLNFMGNRLDNIDPYKFFPDPNKSIDRAHEGEYVGWIDNTSYNALLREEGGDGRLFNVKYLTGIKNRGSVYSIDRSAREDKIGGPYEQLTTATTYVDVYTTYSWIIPKDFGLSDSTDPEIWMFEIAADTVIIRAEKMNLKHGRFPVAIIAPDYDGYSSTPLSRLEILYGLQHVLDFLFNSHIANVRKAVNDMIVYDPYTISSTDMENPGPGKLIRTRRPAWGKGIKDSVMQLGINDITRANISDSDWIVQWMQRIAGTDDAMMGSLRGGGPDRLTAGEFEGTQQGGLNRLDRIATIISTQGMQIAGELIASHTQEFMEDDQWVQINGEWAEKLAKDFGVAPASNRMLITPDAIDINYDIMVRDGATQGASSSRVWTDIFQAAAQNPEMAKEIDMFRLFSHIAKQNGAKNIEEFRRNTNNANITTQPNEQVEQEVQRGNLVPLGV